jgi:hypothetical protein
MRMISVIRFDPVSGMVCDHRNFFDDDDALREAGFG